MTTLKRRAASEYPNSRHETQPMPEATVPDARMQIGTSISEASRRLGIRNEEIEMLERSFPRTPAVPMHFE
ncbi:MAG: hypothetical protein MUE46_12895 [Xanthomonadales bacterium]|jgi:hypothetical protein|nr:hypothetical protein [Xanthomonadales bacterium]